MTKESIEMVGRAEAAFELFLNTKVPEADRHLARDSHRIAFIAGFVMALMQERWPDKGKK